MQTEAPLTLILSRSERVEESQNAPVLDPCSVPRTRSYRRFRKRERVRVRLDCMDTNQAPAVGLQIRRRIFAILALQSLELFAGCDEIFRTAAVVEDPAAAC